jgi:hypothetical protein
MEKLWSNSRLLRSKIVSKFYVRNSDLFEIDLCHQAYRVHRSWKRPGSRMRAGTERYESEPVLGRCFFHGSRLNYRTRYTLKSRISAFCKPYRAIIL